MSHRWATNGAYCKGVVGFARVDEVIRLTVRRSGWVLAQYHQQLLAADEYELRADHVVLLRNSTTRHSLETSPWTIVFDRSSTHCSQVLHAMQSAARRQDNISRDARSEHL